MRILDTEYICWRLSGWILGQVSKGPDFRDDRCRTDPCLCCRRQKETLDKLKGKKSGL